MVPGGLFAPRCSVGWAQGPPGSTAQRDGRSTGRAGLGRTGAVWPLASLPGAGGRPHRGLGRGPCVLHRGGPSVGRSTGSTAEPQRTRSTGGVGGSLTAGTGTVPSGTRPHEAHTPRAQGRDPAVQGRSLPDVRSAGGDTRTSFPRTRAAGTGMGGGDGRGAMQAPVGQTGSAPCGLSSHQLPSRGGECALLSTRFISTVRRGSQSTPPPRETRGQPARDGGTEPHAP